MSILTKDDLDLEAVGVTSGAVPKTTIPVVALEIRDIDWTTEIFMSPQRALRIARDLIASAHEAQMVAALRSIGVDDETIGRLSAVLHLGGEPETSHAIGMGMSLGHGAGASDD